MKFKNSISKLTLVALGLLPMTFGSPTLAEETELTANFDSDYILTIPANQTITEKNVNIGDLYVTGNIAPDQMIKVTSKVKHFERVGSNEILPFTLKYSNSTEVLESYNFGEEDIVSGTEKKLDLFTDINDNDWSNAKAGEYKGSIVFTATLT
ncbi:hypothetical protein ACI1UB_05795 [Lactococcus petauri]|uniref:hypothetical protein n=1 Tax=Lactococcus petauri TaxID=1940789 RepID=UPI0038519B81